MQQQIINKPFLYIYGLGWYTDGANQVFVNSGQCRDSTNSYDIVMPNNNVVINTLNSGLYGIDSGDLQVSSVYEIYALGDTTNNNPSGLILHLQSSPAPLRYPDGYNVSRLIGYVNVNASGNLMFIQVQGSGNDRTVMFIGNTFDFVVFNDIPPGIFTPVNLYPKVPLGTQLAYFYTTYYGSGTGDSLSVSPYPNLAGTGRDLFIFVYYLISSTQIPNVNWTWIPVNNSNTTVSIKGLSAGSQTASLSIMGYKVSL